MLPFPAGADRSTARARSWRRRTGSTSRCTGSQTHGAHAVGRHRSDRGRRRRSCSALQTITSRQIDLTQGAGGRHRRTDPRRQSRQHHSRQRRSWTARSARSTRRCAPTSTSAIKRTAESIAAERGRDGDGDVRERQQSGHLQRSRAHRADAAHAAARGGRQQRGDEPALDAGGGLLRSTSRRSRACSSSSA